MSRLLICLSVALSTVGLSCAGVDLKAPSVEIGKTDDGCRRAVVEQEIPTGSSEWKAVSTVVVEELCRDLVDE